MVDKSHTLLSNNYNQHAAGSTKSIRKVNKTLKIPYLQRDARQPNPIESKVQKINVNDQIKRAPLKIIVNKHSPSSPRLR